MLGAKVLLSLNNNKNLLSLKGEVTTYAGISSISYYSLADGYINSKVSKFNYPVGLVKDSNNNIFVSDLSNQVIRKITPDGVTSLFVGTPLSAGTVDGIGSAAKLDGPGHMIIDSSENILVSCQYTIRRITPSGEVSTYAGLSGVKGVLDGPLNIARFNRPWSMRYDSTGNLFISDLANHNIRKIDTSGNVTTFAGSSAGDSGDVLGIGTNARFSMPLGIEIDSNDNLYVCDAINEKTKKITPTGLVTDFLGSIIRGAFPVLEFNSNKSYLYMANSSQIYKYNMSTNKLTSYSGIIGVTGNTNTSIERSTYAGITDLLFDDDENIYVTENTYNNIRKIIPSLNIVINYQGPNIRTAAYKEGVGPDATIKPKAITFDSNSNMYFIDTNFIRKIDSNGKITVFVGDYSSGYVNSNGLSARFNNPLGITCDSDDNLYVVDSNNHRIRKIIPSGEVSTFAGSLVGILDGTGTNAQFSFPSGITFDPLHNVLYVTDESTIRKITLDGQVTTFAGNKNTGYLDGFGTDAKFNKPTGLALDANGNLFVADTFNDRIRKITSDGIVSTFVGGGSLLNTNIPSNALIKRPYGLTISNNNIIYVSDSYLLIRKITPSGTVTNFAGKQQISGYNDGTNSNASFISPLGLALDSTGVLYVADSNTIRQIT